MDLGTSNQEYGDVRIRIWGQWGVGMKVWGPESQGVGMEDEDLGPCGTGVKVWGRVGEDLGMLDQGFGDVGTQR